MSSAVDTGQDGHITGYGSPSYRNYVLLLLMAVYTLNFIDRTLIAVVAQPIIESFELTDSQWGLLYGPRLPFSMRSWGFPLPCGLIDQIASRLLQCALFCGPL